MPETQEPTPTGARASDDPSRRLDDYLDGRLEGAELAAFESTLASRPDLRAEIKLQARIDDSMRRRLGSDPQIDQSLRRQLGRDGRGAESAARRGRGWWWYAAAAAVALAALPALWFGAKRALQTELEETYWRTVAAGFKPAEVCTTDEAFRAWVREKYNAGLEPVPDRAGVEFVGWSYTRVLGPYSAILLARAEGREIVVVMDRREQAVANPPSMPRFPGGLNVYRREIGKLAFYEVSPLDHAAVIGVLREVPAP